MSMLIKKPSPTLLIILVAFVTSALAWNALTPAYENLDEIEHAEVVRHIANTGRLPVHGEAEAAGYHVFQEASQPPLYHILAAGWSRLWGLPAASYPAERIPEDLVACGPSDTFYNKATWTRPGVPWRIYILRAFSTLLQLATVAGAWTLARRLFPAGPIPLLTTAIVAFNPQFLLIAAGVNNDNLVTPLATWGLVLAYDFWRDGPTPRRLISYGLLGGLAFLTKLSGLGLVGLGGLALMIRVWQERPLGARDAQWRRDAFRRLATWALLLIIPALLIAAPWLLRNLRLYGDPTALAPMLEKVGRRPAPPAWGEARLMALSYWGQMPCSFYPRALTWPYLLLMAGGLVGLALGWRRFDPRQRVGLALGAIWFAVITLAWMRWNAITPAPGGRLLFPAAPALALLLAAGWNVLLSRRWLRIWAAFLPIWALVALRFGPVLLFAPPPRLPAAASPPNPTELVFQQPNESERDGSIALRGYTAHITQPRARCLFASSSYCAPALDITLYWQAQATPAANWTMALQLVSPVPGDTTLRLNYNHWPGRGNLPTSTWPEGPIWRDHYVIPLPAGKYVTSAWRVQVAMIDPQSGQRVPVQQAGAPAGDAAALKLLRVPDGNPPLFTDGQHPPEPPRFGEAVELRAYHIERNPTAWRVALAWESVAPLPTDATVFVHAYDADGNLLATGDGPPRNGHFPTSLWQPGDRIIDIHTLPAPDEGEIARVAVGLYDPATGERLPASQASAPLPNHAVILWEAEP
jgi:hypothetical protein